MNSNTKKRWFSAFWGTIAATLVLLICAGYACGMPGNSGEAYAEDAVPGELAVPAESAAPASPAGAESAAPAGTESASPAGSASLTATNSTTFYFTNDVHGNFEYSLKTNGMSYATAKALKDAGNTGGSKAFLVDAGDHVSGSSYSNYDQGKAVLQIMNDAGYDFRVPGNHEFDYGSSTFFKVISKSATYYACNFYNGSPTQRGSNILDSYKVFDGANGEKIALIGVMTPETITASAPGYFQDDAGNWTMFVDSSSTVTTIYDQLNTTISDIKTTHGQNTICIAVGHLGNEASSVAAGNDSTTVIQHSSGLSAFIDGHSHTIEDTTVTDADGKSVLLLQAASGIEASSKTETTGINRIGSLTIAADGTVSGTILTATDGVYSEVVPDATVQQEEVEQINTVTTALNEEVSSNNIEFASAEKTIQRGKANSLADFVTDGLYYYANNYADSKGTIWKCDAVMINGGAIRGTVATGTDTLKSFMDVLPFINKLVVVEVTGQQILDALEFGAKDIPSCTFGGFMQVSGLTYNINPDIPSTVQTENGLWAGPPTGAYRVQNVQIYDQTEKKFKKIDLAKTYKIAGNDFNVGNCGDGFMMFRGSVKHADYNDNLTYQILAQYVKDFKKDAGASLPEITTANSPLSSLEGFLINYENKDGSGRITTGALPDQPGQKDDDTTTVSSVARTGDSAGVFAFGAALVAAGAGIVAYGWRRKVA